MQNEVVNNLEGEQVGQIKMSKIEKFFLSQKEKFNKHVAGFEGSISNKVNKFVSDFNNNQQSFINNVNGNLDKIDKKYSGMYNMLVRKFLVELEQRIYTSELANRSMLAIFSEKFHKIESDLNKINSECGTNLSLQDYIQNMQELYTIKVQEIHTANTEAAEKEQAEADNVQSVQEKESKE